MPRCSTISQGWCVPAHAYYADHKVLPPAVVPNPDLPPEKRLSGFVLLLPYLEKASRLTDGKEDGRLFDDKTIALANELSRSIDLKKAWDDPVNLKAAKTLFPPLLVPGSGPLRDAQGFAVSHVAFVRGADGKDDGAFTDDATLTISGGKNAIVDGTSVTLALGQVLSELGPWTAAGAATSRWIAPLGSQSSFGTRDNQLIYAANCDSYPYVLDLKATPSKDLVRLVTRSARDIYDTNDIVRYRSMDEAQETLSRYSAVAGSNSVGLAAAVSTAGASAAGASSGAASARSLQETSLRVCSRRAMSARSPRSPISRAAT